MRRRIAFVLAGLALAAGPAYAQKSRVLNTGHDLRTNKAVGDACIACHTPHNANTNYQALQWVRGVRTTGYQVYDTTVNPDFAGGAVSVAGGNSVSLLCMSCHDGAAALNVNWQNQTNAALRSGALTGNSLLGLDLRNDHPVGFAYANSVTAKPNDYNATPTAPVKVFAGRVECASCHNAHDGTVASFLVRDNNNSALCLSCHK